jgi:asparagine synthetase B (glutamine-hydrolysing)
MQSGSVATREFGHEPALVDPNTPPWNEDRTVGIVMEGEIYDYDDERRQLDERGHQFVLNNDAEYVLRSYEEHGEDFALRLNGNYVAAIWDQKQNRLILATDRLGTYGLHYAVVGNGLIFASTLGAQHPLLPARWTGGGAARARSFVLGPPCCDVSLLP